MSDPIETFSAPDGRDDSEASALQAVAARYAVALTPEVRAQIAAAPLGPVARQYLPDARELVETPDELEDPIGDDSHAPVPGIVHRYPDRVLLKPLHVCAVYCRFCFRREKVGPEGGLLSARDLAAAIDYIRSKPDIWEVILTGGDPLVLSPRRLREILAALDDIAHVRVIRFHTRVPVAAPGRVTAELVSVLAACGKAVYVVLHCNHPDELTAEVAAAAQSFVRAGIPLLSQSTLLRGVNDDASVLEVLYRRLVELKIKPYYLHHPDKAPGTSHFRLSLKRGQAIVRDLWRRLSGIARPQYILDIPGGYGKVSAAESAVVPAGPAGSYTVVDPLGRAHVYADTTSADGQEDQA